MLTQIDTLNTIITGKVTVPSFGTRVSIPVNICKSITIKALSTNTGFIYIGTSTVANTNGFQLLANDTISFDISNTGLIFLDSSVSNEGVTYLAIN